MADIMFVMKDSHEQEESTLGRKIAVGLIYVGLAGVVAWAVKRFATKFKKDKTEAVGDAVHALLEPSAFELIALAIGATVSATIGFYNHQKERWQNKHQTLEKENAVLKARMPSPNPPAAQKSWVESEKARAEEVAAVSQAR